MAIKTLLSQTGALGPGQIQNFSSSDNIKTVQFNPQGTVGFTGTVLIEGSSTASPGNNDFYTLAQLVFTGHTTNFSLDIESNVPWMRARITASALGAIAVFADSSSASLAGGLGTNVGVTTTVSSSLRCGVVGPYVKVDSPVVAQISSDDVFYSGNVAQTITDVLDGKQDLISTDLTVLDGITGLVGADFQKLADTNATATELNRLVGVTSSIQAQLDTKAAGSTITLTGLTTQVAQLNTFFAGTTPTVTMANVNAVLTGITATAAEINQLHNTVVDGSPRVTSADFIKLGDITASAVEINKLAGFSGTVTDLNRIVDMTASAADLDTIAGLGGFEVSSVELKYLAGLTENVQSALDTIPAIAGLTSSVNDLNLLVGAATGTGAYSAGALDGTEFSYLNGVSSNIQTQLNAKRSVGVTIGLSEISGISITTTELNYLQGASSNLQAQLNNVSSTAITSAGSTFTGLVNFRNGTAGAPGAAFAGAPTSGVYLYSSNGVGITVGGVRFVSMDGTDVIFGTGAVNGQPSIKGAGMAVTDPAYTFQNDKDTGMYWISANSLGFAAGGVNILTLDGTAGVLTIGGAASTNRAIVHSGISDTEKLLGRQSLTGGSVSGAVGNTVLYTVPTGRKAMISRIMVRLTSITTGGSGASRSVFRFNVGITGSNYVEFVDNITNTTIFNPAGYAFATVGQVMPLGIGANAFPAISGAAGASYASLTAGAALTGRIHAQADFDTWNFDVFVYGYEFV